jgi:prophage regulatory protein
MQSQSGRRFWRLPEVQRAVPLSRSRIYELIAANRFPAPVKLSERASAWNSDEVEAWLDARIAASREAA